ncbi:UDP-glucose 4-epimerase GalE [Bradyrhizobium sp. STM 3562]|uniref:UDP-glucose 4-epimerase GalE n=1 Tax=Bradyrhizobium sp. STM 3562 TaxID=578924 RepID=UPI00388EDA99
MSVLVTGGAGYIGSHMVHTLVEAGERVVVLDNLSTGRTAFLPRDVPVIVGDVGDAILVASLIKSHRVEAILHFAASIVVSESIGHPLDYYRNNTANSRTLLETAIAGGVRHFIFSSTAAVYGNPLQVPVSEDAVPVPLSPYGWSKLMTEVMLQDAATAHGLSYVILRYFNVAGADPRMRTGHSAPDATHLIKVAIQAALGLRDHLDVFGTDYPTPDGTCIRDYIHVCDLARAHLSALDYLRSKGPNATFNCGYGRGYSVLQVIDSVRRAVGHDIPVRIASRREGDPVAIIAQASKIRSRLSWSPQFDDLDTIIDHALAWERTLMRNRRTVEQ